MLETISASLVEFALAEDPLNYPISIPPELVTKLKPR